MGDPLITYLVRSILREQHPRWRRFGSSLRPTCLARSRNAIVCAHFITDGLSRAQKESTKDYFDRQAKVMSCLWMTQVAFGSSERGRAGSILMRSLSYDTVWPCSASN